MATLGKCPDCPKGTKDRILVMGKCPFHAANPTLNNLAETGIKKAEKEIESLRKEINSALPKKQRKPIKKVSDKLKKAGAEYSKLRAEFLKQNKFCQAVLKGCTIKASEVHHKQGRGKNLNNTETYLAVCRNCHTWITENSREAIEKGLSMRRNTKHGTDTD